MRLSLEGSSLKSMYFLSFSNSKLQKHFKCSRCHIHGLGLCLQAARASALLPGAALLSPAETWPFWNCSRTGRGAWKGLWRCPAFLLVSAEHNWWKIPAASVLWQWWETGPLVCNLTWNTTPHLKEKVLRAKWKEETHFFISCPSVCKMYEGEGVFFAGRVTKVIDEIWVYCWVRSRLTNFIHTVKSNGAKWLDWPWNG